MKEQQSFISVFEVYLTIPSGNFEYQPRYDVSIPCIGVWYIYRDTEQLQEEETSSKKIKAAIYTEALLAKRII